MPKFNNPVSIAALAKHCGVTRQRIYNMIKAGTIKPIVIGGSLAFTPTDAELIIDAVRHIQTRMGTRTTFDFV